jgi:hypothetical protein
MRRVRATAKVTCRMLVILFRCKMRQRLEQAQGGTRWLVSEPRSSSALPKTPRAWLLP